MLIVMLRLNGWKSVNELMIVILCFFVLSTYLAVSHLYAPNSYPKLIIEYFWLFILGFYILSVFWSFHLIYKYDHLSKLFTEVDFIHFKHSDYRKFCIFCSLVGIGIPIFPFSNIGDSLIGILICTFAMTITLGLSIDLSFYINHMIRKN